MGGPVKKSFDAVAFQRRIREELGRRYDADRDGFLRELREKYEHLRRPAPREAS